MPPADIRAVVASSENVMAVAVCLCGGRCVAALCSGVGLCAPSADIRAVVADSEEKSHGSGSLPVWRSVREAQLGPHQAGRRCASWQAAFVAAK